MHVLHVKVDDPWIISGGGAFDFMHGHAMDSGGIV